MMNHEEWQVLVSVYHDGELSREERAMVDAHLAECAACMADLESYRRLGRTIRALPQSTPSRELWLRVREGLSPWWVRLSWRRFLPLASAVATLVVGITLVLSFGLPPMAGDSNRHSQEAPAAAPSEEVYVLQEAPSDKAAPAAPTIVAPEGHLDDAVATPSAGPIAGAEAPNDLMTCPGRPLALTVVTLSTRTDARLGSPRLSGVLYNAEGHPLPASTVVISGTADWWGAAVTGPDGSFVLDLPQEGTYRLVLALAEEDRAAYGEVETEGLSWDELHLPEMGRCLCPLDMTLPAILLGPHDEAIFILRAE